MKAGFPFSSFMNLDLRYLLVDLMFCFVLVIGLLHLDFITHLRYVGRYMYVCMYTHIPYTLTYLT